MACHLNTNEISFTLSITLAPAQVSEFFLNIDTQKHVKLLDIKAEHIARWHGALQDLIEFDKGQLNSLVIYDKDTIAFKDRDNWTKHYTFPTKRVTIHQFVDVIVEFEKFSRPKYQWLSGINCQNVFYEGIFPCGDGSYRISWGS